MMIMVTFRSHARDKPIAAANGSEIYDAPQGLSPPSGCYTVRQRVELNDDHLDQESIGKVADAVNTVHLKVLRKLAEDPVLKRFRIYIREGDRLMPHALGELAGRPDFDTIQVMHTPYIDPLDGKYFYEKADHKIEFYLVTSSKKLVEAVGRILSDYEGVRPINALGSEPVWGKIK